jgi:BirA family biotin operon repressor/biotin-[acetyl-CoA-carboxylase] ligase
MSNNRENTSKSNINEKMGFKLIRLGTVTSTNDVLKQPLSDDVDITLPVFVLAVEQTKGRGRLGRSWQSKPGGVYLSLLWPTELTADQALCLPLLTALAVRAAIQPLTDQNIVIKWPNDLLVTDDTVNRKMVGILVELIGGKAIIGVGVNVYPPEKNQTHVDKSTDTFDDLSIVWLAGEAHVKNTALDSLLETTVDELIKSLLDYLKRWQDGNRLLTPFVAEYNSHLGQIGKYVEARNASGGAVARGTVLGINDIGQLVVEDDGVLQAISSGDVTLRRNVV